jgi:hypothetical protein
MPTGTCPYRNTSNQMMILHCIGPEAFFPEKVVFPFEDWLFRCPPHSRVTIWTHGLKGAEQLDSINAEDLLLPAEVVPQEGADAGESRELSISPRLGGANVRVFTNRDDDHQVKSRGIASVSCGGKISGVLPISLPLHGPAGCSSRWSSDPAREDHHGQQQGCQYKLAQHHLHRLDRITAQATLSADSPDDGAPQAGVKPPRMGTGLPAP